MAEQKKRYKPTKEVIEESFSPQFEHRLMKYPGQKAKDITDYNNLKPESSEVDEAQKKEYQKGNEGRKYSLIHTHSSENPKLSWKDKLNFFIWNNVAPWDLKYTKKISALHGGSDIRSFLYNPGWKSEPVAVRDPKTGKLLGYNVLKKTKMTPVPPVDIDLVSPQEFDEKMSKWKYADQIYEDAENFDDIRMKALIHHNPSEARRAYDMLIKKYHLKSRFVPAKDYQVNDTGTAFETKKLESRVAAVAASIFLISSIFFLSANLTGNIIASLNPSTSNLIGEILFILGIIGAFFYLRNKR